MHSHCCIMLHCVSLPFSTSGFSSFNISCNEWYQNIRTVALWRACIYAALHIMLDCFLVGFHQFQQYIRTSNFYIFLCYYFILVSIAVTKYLRKAIMRQKDWFWLCMVSWLVRGRHQGRPRVEESCSSWHLWRDSILAASAPKISLCFLFHHPLSFSFICVVLNLLFVELEWGMPSWRSQHDSGSGSGRPTERSCFEWYKRKGRFQLIFIGGGSFRLFFSRGIGPL